MHRMDRPGRRNGRSPACWPRWSLGMVGALVRRGAALPRCSAPPPGSAARRRPGGGQPRGERGTTIVVRFNADTDPGLPWRFRARAGRNPAAARRRAGRVLRRAQPGAPSGHRRGALQRHAREGGASISTRPPASASPSRRWPPGQEMQFPLSFWVDPALATDPSTADVTHHHAVLHVLPQPRRRRPHRRARRRPGPHVGPLVR